MCSCVGLKLELAFSTHSLLALKHSSLSQNAFFPRAKSVCLQHNKLIRLLYGRWFRNPPKKELEVRKEFPKTSFQLRMEWKKGQRKSRHERTQEDYPTSAERTKEEYQTSVVYFFRYQVVFYCSFSRCWVAFLCCFISALFLSFLRLHP